MKFYIKKVIEAKTPMEALRNEKKGKGEITDVWREEKKEDKKLTPAIGFTVNTDNKEDNNYEE